MQGENFWSEVSARAPLTIATRLPYLPQVMTVYTDPHHQPRFLASIPSSTAHQTTPSSLGVCCMHETSEVASDHGRRRGRAQSRNARECAGMRVLPYLSASASKCVRCSYLLISQPTWPLERRGCIYHIVTAEQVLILTPPSKSSSASQRTFLSPCCYQQEKNINETKTEKQKQKRCNVHASPLMGTQAGRSP